MKDSFLQTTRRLVIFLVESNLLSCIAVYFVLRHYGYLNGTIIGGLLGFAVVQSFFAWDKQFRKAEEMEERICRLAVPARREFAEDPRVLMDLYGRNGYDVLRQLDPFYGKWLEVSGTFIGAANSLHDDSIHVSIQADGGRHLNLKFGVKSGTEISLLRAGQRIAAVTRIEAVANYGAGYIALQDSELVGIHDRAMNDCATLHVGQLTIVS